MDANIGAGLFMQLISRPGDRCVGVACYRFWEQIGGAAFGLHLRQVPQARVIQRNGLQLLGFGVQSVFAFILDPPLAVSHRTTAFGR
jgi:hypothetical protein